MGFFKSSKKQTETTAALPKKVVEPVARYVSPNLEKIPSDLSKNQVPGSPRSRPVGGSSLRALPPVTNRIQSPYAANASENNESLSNSKEAQPPSEDLIANSSSESQNTEDETDEEMVMVRPRKGQSEKRDDDVSDVGPAETGDEQSEVVYGTPKNNSSHLNSLFNGHLMKWKFDAEEGPGYIRIPAFLSGLGLIGTTTAALVLYPITWTISSIVISVFVFIIAITTVILDGRFLASSPLSIRAHLRNVITRHFGIFRYLWGRGILYLAGAVSWRRCSLSLFVDIAQYASLPHYFALIFVIVTPDLEDISHDPHDHDQWSCDVCGQSFGHLRWFLLVPQVCCSPSLAFGRVLFVA